jgi:tRNA-2-methylthio-N6-dimethylallyladenosine synthase
MENQIPLPEKKRRLQELLEVQNEISLDLNKRMEGHKYEIIVEGPTKNDPNNWYGRTSGNKMILWPKQNNIHRGDIVQAVVDTAQTWILKGHIVK